MCVAYNPPRSPSGQVLEQLITTADSLRNKYSGAEFVLCEDLYKLDISEVTDH